MLVRRNIELMGTIRALDEVEVHVGGEDENQEGSFAESTLGGDADGEDDGESVVFSIQQIAQDIYKDMTTQLNSVLGGDEDAIRKEEEDEIDADFHNVWKS